MLKTENHFSFTLSNLTQLYSFAREHKLSFIVFKLPHSKKIYLIYSKIDLTRIKIDDLKEFSDRKPVFVFTPYRAKNYSYLYSSDIVFDFQEKKIFYKSDEKTMKLIHLLKTTHFKREALANDYFVKDLKTPSTPENIFKQQIEKAIVLLNQNDKVEKVVLSKVKLVEEKLDPLKLLLKMLQKYDNVLVSLVSSIKAGTWLGATPELLIEKNEQSIFKTFALAGTHILKKEKKNSLEYHNQAFWSEKEIIEQAYVSRFIINIFKTLRLREYEEIGPKNFKMGNLIHLATLFKVDMSEHYGKLLPYHMLKSLHPTSAVCGYPRKEANAIIKRTESHDREFYTGYLGPIGLPRASKEIRDEIKLYVNLRCCQLIKAGYLLYGGIGLTDKSDASKELLESSSKIDLLKNLIENE